MALLTGRNAAALKSADRVALIATAGQTSFSVNYSVGDIDVFLNGVKLVEGDDYYATTGTTVVLTSGAVAGDVIHVTSFNQFSVANTYTKTESDNKYMVATGQTPMSSYLRTPNYGISSWSDTANASLEASNGGGTNGVGIKAWGRSVAGSGGELTYVTDTRGASGQHIWYGYNGSALTQQMKLDTLGRLNLPNQPSIELDGNASTVTFSAGQAVTQFSAVHNYGGMVWDSNTGRVTVPVSGRYLISFGMYYYHAGNCRVYVKHNANIVLLVHSNNTNTDDGTRTGTVVRNMSAGDYINLEIVYAGNYYMGSQHSFMSIHLLG